MTHPDWPAECDQKTFARLRGVEPPLVSRWKKRGMLVLSDSGAVKVAESMALLDSVLHPAHGGRRDGVGAAKPEAPRAAAPADPPRDDRSNYVVQAAREKAASAELKELELAERAGALVAAAAVTEAVQKRVGPAKSYLLSLPRRCAGEVLRVIAGPVRAALEQTEVNDAVRAALAALTDAAPIELVLRKEMQAACSKLSGEQDT